MTTSDNGLKYSLDTFEMVWLLISKKLLRVADFCFVMKLDNA